MKKPRKVAIYKARGMKLRTSGVIFNDEFNTDHIKTSPAKNRIQQPIDVNQSRQWGKDASFAAYARYMI
jgi:hypothetical protein